MRMKAQMIFGTLAVATVGLSTGFAQPGPFLVDPLGDLEGGEFWSRAFSINENGMIVGASKVLDGFDGPDQVAVRWRPDGLGPIMLEGAEDFEFSRGTTVNNDGLVGGIAANLDFIDFPRAFLWSEGNEIDFFVGEDNLPDVRGSRITRVSDHGVVLGWTLPEELPGPRSGFKYDLDTETLTLLDPLADGSFSLASGVNSSGVIVGSANDDADPAEPRSAVRWPDGSTTPELLPGLDAFADYQESAATWIGEDGTIRGHSGDRIDGEGFARNEEWIWDPDTETATSLGFRARGSNSDASLIVGYGYDDGEHTIEFLTDRVGLIWTEADGWIDINTITSISGDYHIFEVTGVSDSGTLIANAVNPDGNIEAVRLLPTCLTLEIDNLVAGERATVRVSGGTPGARGVVLPGEMGQSSRFIDVDEWCATFGFQVMMRGREVIDLAHGAFDDNGEFTRRPMVNPHAEGMTFFFQAAERGTCPDPCMSDILELVVQ